MSSRHSETHAEQKGRKYSSVKIYVTDLTRRYVCNTKRIDPASSIAGTMAPPPPSPGYRAGSSHDDGGGVHRTLTARPYANATEPQTGGSDGRDGRDDDADGGDGDGGDGDGDRDGDATAARAGSPPPDEIVELSDRIRQALECPICMEVKEDLDCYCPNGHVICGPCLVQLYVRDAMVFCPMCRSPMATGTEFQMTATRMMSAQPLLSVACRYRKQGCGALVRVEGMARHETECRYWPDVRCLVNACRWLGTYEKLYEHVFSNHPEAAARTEGNRLVVTDANRITTDQRRTYLVKTDRGDAMLWVLMSRESRNRIRTGVFMVESRLRDDRDGDDDDDDDFGTGSVRRRPTNLSYRISFFNGGSGAGPLVSRRYTRSQTRKVGRWHSSLQPVDGRNDKADSYTRFRSREGRVEVKWFERASATRNYHRTRTDGFRFRAAQNAVVAQNTAAASVTVTSVVAALRERGGGVGGGGVGGVGGAERGA